MTDKNLEAIYSEVSLEFSNPFTKLSQFTKSKFRELFKAASDASEKSLKSVDRGHPNGLFRADTDLQKRIEAKKVQYMDFVPLTVFVPSYLNPKVFYVDYLEMLVQQMRLMDAVTRHANDNMQAIIDGYIGNPQRCTDPNLVVPNTGSGYDVMGLYTDYVKFTDKLEPMIIAGGSASTRPFNQAFARVADWRTCITHASEIDDIYISILRRFDAIRKDNAATNTRISKLVDLIVSNPNYNCSGEVGNYISNQIYRYARLTEFVGATMTAAQVTLKALSDTSAAIARATR